MATSPIPIPAAESPNLISGHDVFFYETDSALDKELDRHIGAALERGDTAIMVATKSHYRQVRKALKLRGIDLKAAIKAEKYIELDAAKTLRRFMVDGKPDRAQFHSTIGELVNRATRTVNGKHVVVFGEMVALLWAEGKRDATVRLESLWNELGERHTFHLLCAYPNRAFERPEHKQAFFSICGEHSEVNKRHSYHADAASDEQLARLKQSSNHLSSEISLSQQRILVLQKVTRAGTWELDIANDIFSFSSAAAKLLGFRSASRASLSQFFGLMYYSGDRDAVFQRLQYAQRHRKELTAHFRIGNGDETRLIQMRGTTFYNAGSPIMLGVVEDITPSQ
ncbi:MAG TPA: MEDS domain-containing protein [Candidatus Angelobacter sp.]|nr:MEDS domain-containing protein [Candidatus Angelobacter sp.]